ncbi:MAG: hypothetical protein ACP5D2_05025, partial [Candidatus Nanoarchaeia archaeon]
TSENNVSIGLWYGESVSGPWTRLNSTNWTTETKEYVNFNTTLKFNNTDIGTLYYFFNATNNQGTTNLTSPTSFTVTKDRINLQYLAGNGEDANRSEDQTTLLSFQAVNANGTIMQNFPLKYSVTYNNLTYYTDNNFIVSTNDTGYANFNFNATCEGEYIGAPKFLVDEQQWKVELNDSLLDYYYQNDSSDFMDTNLFVNGDIIIGFTNPTGADNYTQEQTISFLGYTEDDCGDALEATVVYNANISESNGLVCDDTKQVGANAFTCDYDTTTSTEKGWYNLTMFANYSYHYDNYTEKLDNPGLFYILPLRRLSSNTIIPEAEYYYYDNWNFSVYSTSGDDIPMRIELYLKKGSGGFSECGTLSECENMTLDWCTNCDNQLVYWYKNFTQSDVGTWFYQIQMINNETEELETSTSGTDSFSVNDIEQEYVYFVGESQTPSSAQWGGTDFSFNVSVNSTIDNNVSIGLWYGESVSGPWTRLNETVWNNETKEYVNFNTTLKFNKTDIGTLYYFFHAT